MALVEVKIPTLGEMRGGWAAHAAVYNAYGWDDSLYATEDLWFFHDGGGNWACIRFLGKNKAVLFGHDHEYSEAFFRDTAKDFGFEETDLLKDAPSWWGDAIEPSPYGPYIGFIYGWDGTTWQRADYSENDGFTKVGLLDMIKLKGPNSISDAIKHFERTVVEQDLEALVAADGAITKDLLEAVMPGYNIELGVEAANRFLLAEL